MHWIITYPDLPPSPNDHMHEQKRGKLYRRARDFVTQEARSVYNSAPFRFPLARAKVTLTIVTASGPFKDPDNAAAALKPVVDGLKRGGLIVDDNAAHLERVYRNARTSPLLGRAPKGVVLVLEPLEEPA